MAREYFKSYHSYIEAMENLNDAECGRLWRACLEYSKSGTLLELRGNERILFPSMKSQIDRDIESYKSICETNKQNGSLGGQATATERYRTLPNAPRTPPKDKAKEKDKTKDKAKENTGVMRFTPPTIEDVEAYCRERNKGVNPQKWYDYYTANGWKVGKNPMKDWKASVRTWEENKQKPGRFDALIKAGREASDRERNN